MTRSRRVLVTGAAGYVGRLTVNELANHQAAVAHVVALDVRAPDGDGEPGVTWITDDLVTADLDALVRNHRIDVVVHLASILRPPPDQPGLAYQVDVVGTERLLDACVAGGVARIVVTTSGAAYGYHADNSPELSESDPIRGNADFEYANNKRLVEELLARYRSQHPELAQLIFRPGTIVGPSVDSPVTALFDRRFILGIMGSASPFVFISDRDVVACLVMGVLGDKCGIYNLAGDGTMTGREIARRLNKPYLPLPAPLVGAGLAVARRLGLSAHGAEAVKFLRYRPVLSNRKLKEEFGYTPSLTSEGAFEEYAAGRRVRA